MLTEAQNPNTLNIDRLSTLEMLALINQEDMTVPQVIQQILPEIARAVDAIAVRMRQGGRLIYGGSGTSGRLGVLDAAECVPTFSTPPGLVVGLLAGGEKAMTSAIEGAEDWADAGRDDLLALQPTEQDSVVELSERLGDGGFGTVYKAQQPAIGREVAIKIILPDVANQPEFVRRFEAEAQIIARLEHMHIVPLYDYWRETSGAYLVMRYLRGGSLKDYIAQSGRCTLERTAQILDQIASALALAHRQHIIHRDIKPANILLDEDSNAYLADFGIAKDLDQSFSNGKTDADMIVGTLDYISPEQARGEPVTPRTDIYSLGVVIYEMLTGEHPFPNMSSVNRLYHHINDPLPLIETLDTSISPAVNEVIQKATAKNPDNRYADVLSFAQAFRSAAALSGAVIGENPAEQLTQREHEILHLIVQGRSNREIAEQLVVTHGTVKWYVNQIYRKLGVRSRVQAIIRAREMNLIVSSMVHQTTPTVISGLTAALDIPNPYKGLHAFQASDTEDYFGREALVKRLLHRLDEDDDFAQFLAVVGPSGSGKSSLIKAGVIPALWRGELPGSERWYIMEMVPGEQPLDELEITLSRIATGTTHNLHEQLTRDARGLVRAIQLLLPDKSSQLVLVIDQFEELFTLVQDEAQRQHFLDLIYNAVTARRSRITVIITLRADFFDRPLQYPQFGKLLHSRMETIMPLTAEELERAIMNPAKRLKVTFEEGLVASIVSDMHYQAGALPLLQYALTELFERRKGKVLTQEAYREIGGAVGALAKRAEETYQEFDEEGRELVRQMFLRLITLGTEAEDTRRRTPRAELMAITDNHELMNEVLDTFTNYRLLSTDRDPETRTPTIEVAHEALLNQWERLRGWLDASRRDIQLQRQLAHRAGEWHHSQQDESFLMRGSQLEQFERWAEVTTLNLTTREQKYLTASIALRSSEEEAKAAQQRYERHLKNRAQQVLKALVGVFAVAAILAGILSLFALNASASAEDERNRAQQRSEELTGQNLYLLARQEFDNHHPELALALAVEAYNSGDAPPQLRNLLANLIDSPGVVRVFEGHSAPVLDIERLPGKGQFLSSSGRETLSEIVADDNTIRLWDFEMGEALRRFEGHTDAVIDIAGSPDETKLLSASYDGTFALWDIETGTMLRQFTESPRLPMRVYFVTDQTALFFSTEVAAGDSSLNLRGALSLRNVETGEVIYEFELDNPNLVLVDWTVDDDNERLVTLHADRRYSTRNADWEPASFAAWDLATGEVLQTVRSSGQLYSWLLNYKYLEMGAAVAFAGNGHDVYISDLNCKPVCTQYFYRWNLDTGELTQLGIAANEYPLQFQGQQRIAGLVIRPLHQSFRNQVLVGSSSGEIAYNAYVYDVRTRQPLYLLDTSGVAIFSKDRTFAVMVSPNTVSLFEPLHQEEIVLFNQLGSHIASLSEVALWSGNGRHVLTGHADGSMYLWEPDGAFVAPHQQLESENPFISELTYTPDGQSLFSGGGQQPWQPGWSKGMFRWDVNTGEVSQQFEGQNGIIWNIEFSHNGKLAVSISSDVVILWDMESETVLHQWSDLPDEATGVAFSPGDDLIYLAMGSNLLGQRSEPVEETVVILDVETGRMIETIALGEPFTHAGTSGIAVSPNGTYLVVGSQTNLMVVWDLERREIVRSLIHEGCWMSFVGYELRFTPDGKHITVGYERCGIALWDIEIGRVVRMFRTDRVIDDYIASDLSADGTMIAAVGGSLGRQTIFSDNAAVIWNLETGAELYRFLGHTDLVWALDFSPDGQHLASGGYDGTIRIWPLDDSGAAEYNWLLENRHVPTLTCEQWEAYGLPERCSAE